MYVCMCVCVFSCVHEFVLFVTFKSWGGTPVKTHLEMRCPRTAGVYQCPIGTPNFRRCVLSRHGCVALKARPKGRTCKRRVGGSLLQSAR